MHYFAYGSNLHPVRLVERIPSASFVYPVRLPHHRLAFHKQSHDGSGKCSLVQTGFANDSVYGAVYRIDPGHKPLLDKFEGAGYNVQTITLHHQGERYDCFTYLADQTYINNELKPYHWYKALVVHGARHLRFPESYITSIELVESIEDPEDSRRIAHTTLIQKMIGY